MTIKIENLINSLTTPLLEPELSGSEIGRNRLRVIEQLSSVLNNAHIQIWLVDTSSQCINTRLAYVYPKPNPPIINRIRGYIATEESDNFINHEPDISIQKTSDPSDELKKVVREVYKLMGVEAQSICEFPLFNPIPKRAPPSGDPASSDLASSDPPRVAQLLAWAFAAEPNTKFTRAQSVAARALCFNLSILLEHGRSHRIVEATNACAKVLHATQELSESLLRCSGILARSCAAKGAGYISIPNSGAPTIGFAEDTDLTDQERREVVKSLCSIVSPVPTLQEYFCHLNDHREHLDNSPFGNLLIIPIIGPGLFMRSCSFATITEDIDIIGQRCNFYRHAIFLVRKASPDYLGVNFSATDKRLCQAVTHNLASATFSRFFEQLFLMQSDYCTHIDLTAANFPSTTLQHLKSIAPTIVSIDLINAYRDNSGKYHYELIFTDNTAFNSNALQYIESTTPRIYDLFIEKDDDVLNYACYIDGTGSAFLIFQLSTNYIPLRFYVIELESQYIEQFRLQLLKHFMRELFLLHRAKDYYDQRVSLLAQMRHAIVDPIAAATNNLDTYNRHMRVFRAYPIWLDAAKGE